MTTPYVPQTWADGPAGGTPITAARLTHIEDGIDGGANGAAWGILNCSAMTLASQINAATAGAPAGTRVWLGPRPSGAELGIDEPLILRPNMAFEGLGGRERLTRLKVTPSFPAGQPVVAAQGYLDNAALCDSPVVLRGVDIDADGKVGSHGLVVFHFWSLFEDIQIHNVTGNGTLTTQLNGGAAAILLANRGIDGTTVTGNSHSENVLHDIRINACSAGASGIVQQSFTSAGNGGQANQDGHLIGCWIAGGGAVGGGRGLDFARGAGWTFRDLHLYGIGDDAVRVLACYATDADGWYIENYGLNDAAGDNYHGVQMEFLRGRGSTLTNVKVWSSQVDSPAAGRLTNFHLRAGGSQVGASVAVSNCVSGLNLSAAPTVRKTQAWRFGESGDSARSLHVRMAGNLTDQLDGWMAPARFIHAATTTLDENGTAVPRTVAYATAPTIDPTLEGDRINITATGDITGLGVSTTGARDRQQLDIAVLASGANRAVSFATAIRPAGSLSRGPHSVPAGQVLLATVEYSALAGAWVLTDAGVSAT